MTSFIIVSSDKTKREAYALDFCQKNAINPLDITSINKDSVEKKGAKKVGLSIGIEQIKQLQESIYLKPLKSAIKACIIQDAQLLTIEAQNSMLKLLEEPPDHTMILLLADRKETLLPTILSRCQLIELPSHTLISDIDKTRILDILESLESLTVSGALAMAESLSKQKDETITLVEKIIILAHEQLLMRVAKGETNREAWYAMGIKQFQSTHTLLKTTNVNPRFALEHLFLSFIDRQ